jgi:hypothetical protein
LGVERLKKHENNEKNKHQPVGCRTIFHQKKQFVDACHEKIAGTKLGRAGASSLLLNLSIFVASKICTVLDSNLLSKSVVQIHETPLASWPIFESSLLLLLDFVGSFF